MMFRKTADSLEKHRNLPVANFGDKFTTNQTASQFRTLISRFGYICHLAKLPTAFFQSEQFLLYTCFAKIVSYLNSPNLHRTDTDILENLIARFIKGYAKLYGTKEVKNKFHHLIHYPRSISSYGPALFTNTLIYERTLRKIKPMIRGRKNIIGQIAIASAFQSTWFIDSLREMNDKLRCGPSVVSIKSTTSKSS